MEIAGEDLNLGPQMAINLSLIPLRTLWNSKDITDAPLACRDNRLKKTHKVVLASSSPSENHIKRRKFHFGTEIQHFLYKRMPLGENIYSVIDPSL